MSVQPLSSKVVPTPVWLGVALLAIAIGIRYLLTEPLIFEPGGWFALDGRRVLEAATTWQRGGNPYDVEGFLYSPVGIALALPLTLIPGPVAILLWIAASAVIGGALVGRELRGHGALVLVLGVAAALLFVPTIADLVLANVTVALVSAVWVAVRGGRIRSGVAFGLLAMAFPKPLLVPIAIWLLIARRRAGIGMLAGAAAGAAVSLLVTGLEGWVWYADQLRGAGSMDLIFVGNYGLSRISEPLAVAAGVVSLAAFAWFLRSGDDDASLLSAVALGPFISPYVGIYAGVPLLLALPALARRTPLRAVLLSLVAIVTAPLAVVPAGLALVSAVWRVAVADRSARDSAME